MQFFNFNFFSLVNLFVRISKFSEKKT